MLRSEVVISQDCVEVLAEWAGLRLPATLAPEPRWRDETEQAHRQEAVLSELDALGLLDGDRPSEDLTRALHLLCLGAEEFFAYVDTPERTYRLHAAASGRSAVLACSVPDGGGVLLRPARPEALAEEVVAELPACRPGGALSLSVPESQLRAPESPRGDLRRLLALYEQPRYAAGQVCAGVRGRHGTRLVSGDESCTFIDTEHGRWLSYRTGGDGERYVVTTSGGTETMTSRLYELRDRLRESR